MPVTTIKAVAAMYGNSNYNAFTETATRHLYVGYNGGSSFQYRSYLKFPSLKTIAAIGNNSITITSVRLFCYRTDQGGTTVIAGPSSSTAWNASLAGSASAAWAASTSWKSVTLDANNAPGALTAIRDYTGAWYMHLRTNPGQSTIRLASISTSYVPYIQVTWEYAEKTVSFTDGSTEIDSLICDGSHTATINIDSARYAADASYTLQYSIGDQSGTIATRLPKAGETTTVTWTPGMELLSEIIGAETGDVTITLTAYNSSGGVYRTEKAVLSLSVPDSIVMSSVAQAVSVLNGYGAYGLTDRSFLQIIPVVDASNLYGAQLKGIEAKIGSAETLSWDTSELSEKIQTTWTQGHYDTRGNFLTPDTWASEQNRYLPITSGMIPVIPGVPIHLLAMYSQSHDYVWAGVARFDVNGCFIARKAIQGSATLSGIDTTYTPSAQDAYLRFIVRSFDDCDVQLSYDNRMCGVPKLSAVLAQAGTVTVDVSAVDTRGRNANMTGYTPSTVTVLGYTTPAITVFDIDRIAPIYDPSEQITGYGEADDGAYAWANLSVSLHSLRPTDPASEEQTLYFTMSVTNLSTQEVLTRSGYLALLGMQSSGSGEIFYVMSDDYTQLFPSSMGTPPGFDIDKAYSFEITVTDAAGVSATAYSQIVPGRANFHLAGSKYGVAIGGFSKGTLAAPLFECEYPAVFYNGIDVRSAGWIDLGAANGVSRPTSSMGMQVGPEDAPYVCCYRVEDGNHLFAYARAAFQFNDGTIKQLNLNPIPEKYRPRGYMVRWGAGSGSYTQVRAQIRPDGYIYAESVVNETGKYNSISITWTELWFEWFV